MQSNERVRQGCAAVEQTLGAASCTYAGSCPVIQECLGFRSEILSITQLYAQPATTIFSQSVCTKQSTMDVQAALEIKP